MKNNLTKTYAAKKIATIKSTKLLKSTKSLIGKPVDKSNNLSSKQFTTRHLNDWELIEYSKPKIVSPILIEGMPGIGNVGKITMDILI